MLNIAVIQGICLYILLLMVFKFIEIKRNRNIFRYSVEYIYIVYLFLVLQITGILGTPVFRINWLLNSFRSMKIDVPTNFGEILMILMNIAMFVPLGILTPIVFEKYNIVLWKITVIALFMSTFIELIQGLIGRFLEINDIIANVIGAVIGFAVYNVTRNIFFKIRFKKRNGTG